MRQAPFSTELYLEAQVAAFDKKLQSTPAGCDTVIEFGGKPFGDMHASRVLPGYDPDCKAGILRTLQVQYPFDTSLIVNARDILLPPDGRTPRGRIRGDSGLRYDAETIRLANEARDVHCIDIDTVTVSVTPLAMSNENEDRIGYFADSTKKETGLDVVYTFEIPGYPQPACLFSETNDKIFESNGHVSRIGRNVLLLSAGGGSGKFGVALSEVRRRLVVNEPVDFIKFETFPAFGLSADDPVNLAFIAATADLGNILTTHEHGTNYDKDDENFLLIQSLMGRFHASDRNDHLRTLESQFDFGVNKIHAGILDMAAVHRAATEEIRRRIQRYESELLAGDEKPTTTSRIREIATYSGITDY